MQSFSRPRKYAKYAHVTRRTKTGEFYITRPASCGRAAGSMTKVGGLDRHAVNSSICPVMFGLRNEADESWGSCR